MWRKPGDYKDIWKNKKKKNFLVVLELSSQWQQAAEVVSSQRLL